MSIDARRLLRRLKPERRRGAVFAELPILSVGDVDPSASVLLDTNVYINDVAGRLPTAAVTLLDRGRLFHCSVCVAELMTGVCALSPNHPGWNRVRDHYVNLVEALPPTRLLTPDQDIWTEAGLIAGILARTQSFQPHQRKECLNDALILLTAAKAGVPVLTSDSRDFDLIRQVGGRGHYIAI